MLTEDQKTIIDVAEEVCDEEETSTEYMLAYMEDTSGANLDDILDYLEEKWEKENGNKKPYNGQK